MNAYLMSDDDDNDEDDDNDNDDDGSYKNQLHIGVQYVQH
jgi:hypothetical protein